MAEAPYRLGVVLWQTGRDDEAALRSARPSPGAPTTPRRTTCSDRTQAAGEQDAALREFREAIRMNLVAEAYTSLGQMLTAAHDTTAPRTPLHSRTAEQGQGGFAGGGVRHERGRERLRKDSRRRHRAVPRGRQAGPGERQAHYQLALALRRAESSRRPGRSRTARGCTVSAAAGQRLSR